MSFYSCFLKREGKPPVADRVGIVSEDRREITPPHCKRLSYRASLLINLAASVILYGLAYLAVREIIHLLRVFVTH